MSGAQASIVDDPTTERSAAIVSLGARFASGRAAVVGYVPGWPPGITCREMESKDPYFSKLAG